MMSGMLIGSCIASNYSNRFRQPLHAYAFSQAILSGASLAFVLFRPQLYALLEIISTHNPNTLALAESLRLTVAGAVLLVPTSLIGCGFPLIVESLTRLDAEKPVNEEEYQSDATLVYFANLLGSLLGALASGFWLLPQFGITSSIQVAALASLLSAISAYTAGELIKADMPEKDTVPSKVPEPDDGKTARLSYFEAGTLVIFSGLMSMLLEMLWVRLGMLMFGSSSYAFSVILACQLLGLSAGAFLISVWSDKRGGFHQVFAGRAGEPLPLIRLALLLSGSWILLTAYIFWALPYIFLQITFWLQSWAGAFPTLAFLLSRLLIGGFLIVPACTLLGTIFPIAVKSAPSQNRQIPWLYVLNTFGSVFGCIVGGVLLLPALGRITLTPLMLAFILAAFLLLGFTLLLKPSSYPRAQKILVGVAAVYSFIVVTVPPIWPKSVMSSGPAFLVGLSQSSADDKEMAYRAISAVHEKDLLFYQEGMNAITTVMQNVQNNLRFLKTDGKMEAALPSNPHLPAPTSDQPTHILLGELPLLVCPRQPNDVLLIGLGSGVTADAILDHTSVSNLTVAEMENSVRAAASLFSANRRNDGDRRMRIIKCDGRNFLSLVKMDYDVIVSQPGEPYLAGMADLYTLEFWELAKRRLRTGGVFCQWVPLYAVNHGNLLKICRTFHAAFPSTLIFRMDGAGEILMIGFNTPERTETDLSKKQLFTYIQPNTPVSEIIKGYFPFSSGLWVDYNQFLSRFSQPKVRTRLAYLGFEEPLALLTTMRMGPEDFARLVGNNNERAKLNLDDSTTVEWAMPIEIGSDGPILKQTIVELFSGVPSDFDHLFFNIGARKEDTASFISECAARYADLASRHRYRGEKEEDFERCMELAKHAYSFAFSPASAIGRVLVSTYFGRRVLPYLRNFHGASPGSLQFEKDARLLGLYDAALGNKQDALASFRRATAIAPHSSQAWLDLGRYCLFVGLNQEALNAFESLIKVDPYSARAKEGAGLSLIALGQSQPGISLLKQALSINPNLARARLALGRQLLSEGHEEEGLSELYWASKVSSGNCEANLSVAAYLALMNKWQAAEENLKILKKLWPGDSRVNYLAEIISAKRSNNLSDAKLKALLDPVCVAQLEPTGTKVSRFLPN
jgi:predicted membrane-bound spermidine synthase/tetratricopeptide (TPR) repeat protein